MECQKLQKSSRFGLIDLHNQSKPSYMSEEYWLLFVFEGAVTIKRGYSTSNDIIYSNVLLFSANEICHIKESEVNCVYYYKIDLNCFLSEIQKYILSVISKTETNFLPLRGYLREYVELSYMISQEKSCSDSLLKIMGHQLLHLFSVYYNRQELTSFFSPLITEDLKFRIIVEDNCLNIKNLSELANMANYSRSGFIKKFHRIYKQSPQKWIAEYKANRILQDIRMMVRNSSEIVDYYGFSSLYHFYSFCRNTYHCNYSELRKNPEKGEEFVSFG